MEKGFLRSKRHQSLGIKADIIFRFIGVIKCSIKEIIQIDIINNNNEMNIKDLGEWGRPHLQPGRGPRLAGGAQQLQGLKAPLTTQCDELFKSRYLSNLALRLVAYENLASQMVEEVDIEDEASIIATPATASLTSEDYDSRNPEEISAGEEDFFISTLDANFDITTAAASLTSEDDASDAEEISAREQASFICTLDAIFEIPPPPPTLFNNVFSMTLEDFEVEDLLENISMQELPDQVYQDEEIDDPTSIIHNTEDRLKCFTICCLERGQSTYSISQIILGQEDVPTYNEEEEVFNEVQNLAVFPIDPPGRNRLRYESEERGDDQLEFRRNLLEDIPIPSRK